MGQYVSVFVISCVVDFLLIMATKQLYPGAFQMKRALFAALIGGVLRLVCFASDMRYLTGILAQFGIFLLTGLTAFGWGKRALGRCGIFLLLSFALSGLTQPSVVLQPLNLLVSSGLLLVFSLLNLHSGSAMLIPVELTYGTNSIKLMALHDTGNGLRDPVTGKPVLVLGADAAQQLTGLTPRQLRAPVESIGALPGLRLIPYRAVCGSGLLLALRVQNLKMGDWKGSCVVAFAPEVLSLEGKFQALTGGKL